MKIQNLLLAVALLALVPLAAPAKDSPQNEKLIKATDPFETLAETALTGDAVKINDAYKAVQAGRASTRALLPAGSIARYDALFTALEAAQTKHDNLAVSLQGSELYKAVVSALDAKALTIPKEIHLLDYVGFRISALVQPSAPDWSAIAATTTEGSGYWAAVREKVGDTKLRGKMDKALADLTKGAMKHDVSLTKKSVKADLDLVDDIEKYFSK